MPRPQEITASETAWPTQGIPWEMRRVRLAPDRADEFYERLLTLIAEYWGGPESVAAADAGQIPTPEDDPAAPTLCFAAVIYRDPTESMDA